MKALKASLFLMYLGGLLILAPLLVIILFPLLNNKNFQEEVRKHLI